MEDDGQKEVIRAFRASQEKYVYYIIALAVSAIGFSAYRTADQPLASDHWILGIAVLCWGATIFCGFKFIDYNISGLYSNNELFEIQAGRSKLVGKAGIDALKKVMEKNSNTGGRFFNVMKYSFFVGVVCFVGWHIVHMYTLRNFCA